MCPVILPDYFLLILYPASQRYTLTLFLFLGNLPRLTGKLFRLLSLRFSLSLFFRLLLLIFSLNILIRLNGLSGTTTITTATAGFTIRIDTVIDRILDVFSEDKIVRDWLANKSYDFQFEFGKRTLEKYGTLNNSGDGWIFKKY